MKIDYKHNLKHEEAYEKVNSLLSNLQRQYSDKIKNQQAVWNSEHTQMDFSLEVMGFKTSGQVCLRDNQITIEGKLPLMARIFKSKIESVIGKKLDELFSQEAKN